MIDQGTIKRREMLLVASSVLAASAISAMPAAAKTQVSVTPKSGPHSPRKIFSPDEPQAWASRGRRVSGSVAR